MESVCVSDAGFERIGPSGIISIPDDYEYAKFFDRLYRAGMQLPSGLNSKSFSPASKVLVPGERYKASLCAPTGNTRRSFKEALHFIRNNSGFLLGAQGLAMCWERMGYQFPKGLVVAGLDDHVHLLRDAGDQVMVPVIRRGTAGDYGFSFCLWDEPMPLGAYIVLFQRHI